MQWRTLNLTSVLHFVIAFVKHFTFFKDIALLSVGYKPHMQCLSGPLNNEGYLLGKNDYAKDGGPEEV